MDGILCLAKLLVGCVVVELFTMQHMLADPIIGSVKHTESWAKKAVAILKLKLLTSMISSESIT